MLAVSFEGIHQKIIQLLKQRLAPELTYHSISHTLDVTKQVAIIAAAERVHDEQQLMQLRLAALLHDSGFTVCYQRHEQASCRIASEILSAHEMACEMIDTICNLILATQVPQKPKDHLAAILCDADLDYLGRDDFFTLGEKLKQEWFTYNIITTEKEWHEGQIRFLENHRYHTQYSIRTREPVKQQYLKALKKEAALH